MLGLLFILAVVIGAVAYANHRKGTSAPSTPVDHTQLVDRRVIAERLQEFSKRPEYTIERRTYLAIAQSLLSGRRPDPQFDRNGRPLQIKAPAVRQSAPVVRPTAAPPRPHLNPFKELQNINVLLTLGAFLIVASATIFVGLNYDVVTGLTKVAMILIFALAFYGIGLLFYLQYPRLKPAGTTFIAIALIAAPLVGVAAQNFVFQSSDPALVWVMTSLLSLLVYLLTFVLTKQLYVNYFVMLSLFSLVMSGVSAAQSPVYYQAWGSVALGGLFLLLSHFLKRPQLHQHYQTSSAVLVAIGVITSFVALDAVGVFQLAVTVVFAAIYFSSASVVETISSEEKRALFVIGLVLWPLSVWLFGAHYQVTSDILALLLVIVVAAYTGVSLLLYQTSHDHHWVYTSSLAVIGGLVSVVAALLALPTGWLLLFVVATTVLLNGLIVWQQRIGANVLLAGLGIYFLPLITISRVLEFPIEELSTRLLLVGWYTLLAVLFLWLKIDRNRFFGEAWEIWWHRILLWASLLLIWSIVSSPIGPIWLNLLGGGLLAVAIVALSYHERNDRMMIPAFVVYYFAVFSLTRLSSLPIESFGLVLTAAGAVLYALPSWLPLDPERARWTRLAGIVGPFMGAVQGGRFVPQLSLLTAGVLTMTEAKQQHSRYGVYTGAALMNIALQWLLHSELHITELQVYMVLWSAYFGVIAFNEHLAARPNKRDTALIVSLAFLTVPLFLQSLAPREFGYALMLGFESLGLVLLGIALRRRLIWGWGAAALMADVLYQMRHVFLSVPKYLITLVVGLGLLGVAIYLLLKRADDN